MLICDGVSAHVNIRPTSVSRTFQCSAGRKVLISNTLMLCYAGGWTKGENCGYHLSHTKTSRDMYCPHFTCLMHINQQMNNCGSWKHIIPNFISEPAQVEVTDGKTLLIGHTWQQTFIRSRFAVICTFVLKEQATQTSLRIISSEFLTEPWAANYKWNSIQCKKTSEQMSKLYINVFNAFPVRFYHLISLCPGHDAF